MSREEEELIPWADDLPPRIDDGEYDAVILSVKKVERFGFTTVEFLFRLVTMGPFFDARVRGYCNLGPSRHPRIKAHSKLASWMRAIAAFTGGSPSRVTLRSFREFWFTVRVGPVTHKMQERRRVALHERDCYSSVDDIVRVVGKLAELPSDRQPPSQYLNEER